MTDDKEMDLQTLRDESRVIWDANAAYWDDNMGEGNQFQRLLVGPAAERLLQVQPGERILEIACGNGLFARRLAQLGAQVVATDFSTELLARARARTTENADRIEYRQLDVTDASQLASLGEHAFDAAVSNMALMDIASIEPLMNALPRLVKPGGRFVFTITHPCFNHSRATLMVEEEDREGDLVTTFSVKVSGYRSVGTTRGLALVGQPHPQYYFHRTLTELLSTAFRAGLVMDGIGEPYFTETEPGHRLLGWVSFKDIPPVLAVRLRAVDSSQ